jgi:signal transduction histidine kinase
MRLSGQPPAAARPTGIVTYVPLGVIVVALVALVVVPFVGQGYARTHQQELRGAAEPARGLVTSIHLALALGGDALHDFDARGDSSALARYRQTTIAEQHAYEELSVLSERLGPEVERQFTTLWEAAARWHQNVDEFLERTEPGDRPRRAAPTAGLYEDVLVAAARLDEAITRAALTRRQRIVAAERIEMRLTTLLVLVAMVALVMVVWVGRRLRAIAAEAEARRQQAERLMEARARAVRSLSHDLKNPLNVIYSHAQLLEDGIVGEPSTAQKKSLAHIQRSVRALLDLIDDLLELWRAESGELNATSTRTDIVEVVREVVDEYRAVADAAGHSLQLELFSDVPPVETDAKRVRQVLGNLVSNAIKFTPPGGCVTIRLRVRSRTVHSQRGRWIAVEVSDTGPGIPPEKVDTIFEEFTRLQPHVPGIGIGLATSRRIARLLGGDITVQTAPECGATFVFLLPLMTRGDDGKAMGSWHPRQLSRGSDLAEARRT